MADIRHFIEIDGAPGQVYAAVANRAGVAGWWTPRVTVKAGSVAGDSEGDSLRMHFRRGGGTQDIEVVELLPERRVQWSCGPGAFEGTRISFELERRGQRTAVRFAHMGWNSALSATSTGDSSCRASSGSSRTARACRANGAAECPKGPKGHHGG